MQPQVIPTAPPGLQRPAEAAPFTMPVHPSSTDRAEEHVESPGKSKGVLSKVKNKAKKLRNKIKKVTGSSNTSSNTHDHGDLKDEQLRGQGEHLYPPHTPDQLHDLKGYRELHEDDDSDDDEEHLLLGDDQSKFEQVRSLGALNQEADSSEGEVHGGVPAAALAPVPGPYIKPVDDNTPFNPYKSVGLSDTLQAGPTHYDPGAARDAPGAHTKAVDDKSPISPFRSSGPSDSLQAAPTEYHYGVINDAPSTEINPAIGSAVDPYSSVAPTKLHDDATNDWPLPEELRSSADQTRASPLISMPHTTADNKVTGSSNLESPDYEGSPFSTEKKRSHLSLYPPMTDMLSHREPASSESSTPNAIDVAYPHDIAKPNPEFGHSDSPTQNKIAVINEDLPAEMKLDAGLMPDDSSNQRSLMETSVPENAPMNFEADEPVDRNVPDAVSGSRVTGSSYGTNGNELSGADVDTQGPRFDNVGEDYEKDWPLTGSRGTGPYGKDGSELFGATAFGHEATQPRKNNANESNLNMSNRNIVGQSTPFSQSTLYDDDTKGQSRLSQSVDPAARIGSPFGQNQLFVDDARRQSPFTENASYDDGKGRLPSNVDVSYDDDARDRFVPSPDDTRRQSTLNDDMKGQSAYNQNVVPDVPSGQSPLSQDTSHDDVGGKSPLSQSEGQATSDQESWGKWSADKLNNVKDAVTAPTRGLIFSDKRDASEQPAENNISNVQVSNEEYPKDQDNSKENYEAPNLDDRSRDTNFTKQESIPGSAQQDFETQGFGDARSSANVSLGESTTDSADKLDNIATIVAPNTSVPGGGEDAKKVDNRHDGEINTSLDSRDSGLEKKVSDMNYYDPNNVDGDQFREGFALGSGDSEEEGLNGTLAGSAIGRLQGLRDTVATKLGFTGKANPDDFHVDESEQGEGYHNVEDDESELSSGQSTGVVQGMKDTVSATLGYGPAPSPKPSHDHKDDESELSSGQSTGVVQGMKDTVSATLGYGPVPSPKSAPSPKPSHDHEYHEQKSLHSNQSEGQQQGGGAFSGLKNSLASKIGYGPSTEPRNEAGDQLSDDNAEEMERKGIPSEDVSRPKLDQSNESELSAGQSPGIMQGMRDSVFSALGYGAAPSPKPSEYDDHEQESLSSDQSEVPQQGGGALDGLKNMLVSNIGYGPSTQPRNEAVEQASDGNTEEMGRKGTSSGEEAGTKPNHARTAEPWNETFDQVSDKKGEEIGRKGTLSEEVGSIPNQQQAGVLQGLKNVAASKLGYEFSDESQSDHAVSNQNTEHAYAPGAENTSLAEPVKSKGAASEPCNENVYEVNNEHAEEAPAGGISNERVGSTSQTGVFQGLKNVVASKLDYGSSAEGHNDKGTYDESKNYASGAEVEHSPKEQLVGSLGSSAEGHNDKGTYDESKNYASGAEAEHSPKEQLMESPSSQQKPGGPLQGLKNVVASKLGFGAPLLIPADSRKGEDGSYDEELLHGKSSEHAHEPEGVHISNQEVESTPSQQQGTGGALQALRNVVASKLGYGLTSPKPAGGNKEETVRDRSFDEASAPSPKGADQPSSYTEKLMGSAAAAKDYLSSKTGYDTVDNDQGGVKDRNTSYEDAEKPIVTM